jgi:hypothetical protein
MKGGKQRSKGGKPVIKSENEAGKSGDEVAIVATQVGISGNEVGICENQLEISGNGLLDIANELLIRANQLWNVADRHAAANRYRESPQNAVVVITGFRRDHAQHVPQRSAHPRCVAGRLSGAL